MFILNVIFIDRTEYSVVLASKRASREENGRSSSLLLRHEGVRIVRFDPSVNCFFLIEIYPRLPRDTDPDWGARVRSREPEIAEF